MGRKARERMMRGQREARPGQVVYGHQDPRSRNRTAMMATLVAAGGEEREGVRDYLRSDGSARALALLGELEKKRAAENVSAHSAPTGEDGERG
jgi:hypothetical protein